MNNDIQNLNFWNAPVRSIQQFLADPSSLRTEKLEWAGSNPAQRSAYHHLLQIVRNRSLIEYLVRTNTKRPPKPRLQALLALAIVQILENPNDTGSHAKSIHHTVEITRNLCSNKEAGFVNAVCRSITRNLIKTLEQLEQDPEQWPIFYSHPRWLVKRWIHQHGPDSTQKILQWNQSIPVSYLHDLTDYFSKNPKPEIIEPSCWTGFYTVKHSDKSSIDQLMEHPVYIQDPSTAIAPSLFSESPKPNSILDACAAPGGKSVHLFKRFRNMEHQPNHWVATDLSAKRLATFEKNMARLSIEGIQTQVIDWETSALKKDETPDERFDWILIDAPCSSVGVIQKHPEIRWRLSSKDYEYLPNLQFKILESCSQRLKAGGELVYSTCSIDREENQGVIDRFLQSESGSGFKLLKTVRVLPFEKHHDGVGAFLLKKN